MASQYQNIEKYLQYHCHKNDFSSCVVVASDGLALCSAGEAMPDDFVAYLPSWLKSGDNIGKSSGIGELACCCLVPRNTINLMLVWDLNWGEQHLYFAVLTPKLAANTVRVLTDMAQRIRELLEEK